MMLRFAQVLANQVDENVALIIVEQCFLKKKGDVSFPIYNCNRHSLHSRVDNHRRTYQNFSASTQHVHERPTLRFLPALVYFPDDENDADGQEAAGLKSEMNISSQGIFLTARIIVFSRWTCFCRAGSSVGTWGTLKSFTVSRCNRWKAVESACRATSKRSEKC